MDVTELGDVGLDLLLVRAEPALGGEGIRVGEGMVADVVGHLPRSIGRVVR